MEGLIFGILRYIDWGVHNLHKIQSFIEQIIILHDTIILSASFHKVKCRNFLKLWLEAPYTFTFHSTQEI